MKNFYVYGHFNKITRELFYIGKGKNDRAFIKKSRNKFWHNIVNKNGYYIEILENNLSEKEAFSFEIEYISNYKALGLCKANMTSGGGGPLGLTHTEFTKEKLRQYSGQNHHAWGKTRSRVDRIKMSYGKNNKLVKVYEAIRLPGKGAGKGKVNYEKGKLIGTWKCQSLCAEDLGLSRQSVSNCLCKRKPTAGGYIFEFYSPN